MGLLSRLTDSLKRTKEQLFQRFEEVVQQADAPEARTRAVSVDTLDALEEVLIIGRRRRRRDRTQSSRRSAGRARRGESLRDLVKDEIRGCSPARTRAPAPVVAADAS